MWRACADGSDQPVAIKRLRPESLPALDRLRGNAEVANRIGGAHVVPILAVVEAEATVMVVADLIVGDSLETLLARRERLDPAEVITVLAPLAQTLARLHDAGLGHGALTPSNILLAPDGRPLLSDVGVAVALGAAPTDDVSMLAGIGLAACSDGRPHPVIDVLRQAASQSVGGTQDAAGLAAAILASGPAAPIRRSARVIAAASPLLPGRRDRGPEQPPPAAVRDAAAPRARPPHASRLPVGRPAPADPTPATSGSRRRAVAMAAVAVIAICGIAAMKLQGHRMPTPTVTRATGPTSTRVTARPPSSSAPSALPSTGPTAVATDPLRPRVTRNRASAPHWPRVVKRLEDLRAAAFNQAEPGLLARVYAPGSRDLGADRDRIRGLSDRGLHVAHFTATVLTVRPIRVSRRTAIVQVTDRLSAYALETADGTVVRRGAPRDPRTYEMRLVRTGNGWRVSGIVAVG